MSTPQAHKLSFRMKLSFVQENFGTLLLAFLFFVIVLWKSLSTWSLAVNLDDLGVSIPFLLAKWKR
jgi:hypothetical protein